MDSLHQDVPGVVETLEPKDFEASESLFLLSPDPGVEGAIGLDDNGT